MIRAVLLATALALPMPASAQVASPDPQELASVRTELASLFGEIQALRALLAAEPGAALVERSDTPAIVRLDQIEEEMRLLTGRVEELSFRISAIAEDGTRRIGDLEFRLVELEGGDISAISETSLLGGAPSPAPRPSAPLSQTPEPTVSLAITEQADFDAAKGALTAGDLDAAKSGFTRFLSAYPGGPLAAQALFHLGEAQTQSGAHKPAAKAYLDSFTAAPNGPFAAHALMNVALSLGALGKPQEACATLAEVRVRYPGKDIEGELVANQTALGCS